MSELLSSVASFGGEGGANPIQALLGLGSSGLGLFGNLMNEIQRQGQLNMIKKSEKTLGDPTQLAKQVSSATQPLNEGLVQSVDNTVKGSLAESGLSESPGILATTESQALAPFEQQNQSTALQLVMERLGLPIQYASAFFGGQGGNANLAPLLAMLFKGQNQPPPGFMQMLNKNNSGVLPGYGSDGGYGSFNPSDYGGGDSGDYNSLFPPTMTDSPIDFSGGVNA